MAPGIRWSLSLVIACATAPVTWAQDVGATGGLEIASVTGKFAAMQGNRIKVIAADTQEYFVVITNQTKINYQGKADPNFLMPGLMVRFSGPMTQAAVLETPVKAIEVFTLSQQRMSPEQQREQTPGVYLESGDVGGPASKKGATKTEPNKSELNKPEAPKADAKKTERTTTQPITPSAAAQNYRVVGQLLGGQGNKLFVQAGQVRVQLELDPQVAISVSSSDPMFSQIDDEVKVLSGLRSPGQDKVIQAESILITGSKPLGTADAKVAKAKPSRRTNKGKGKVEADASKPVDGVKPDLKKPTPNR